MDDHDIFLIEIGRRGPSGDLDTGTVEWATIRNDVDGLLLRPNITALDDVPDVDAAAPGSGDVLTWDGSAWVPETLSNPVTAIGNTSSVTLDASGGTLTATVNYAGTGAASTAARSDHTHTNPAPTRSTFGPQAYMSGGTRTLGTTNVTLANGIAYVVKARLNMQMRGADAGAAYYQLRLTINGNARTSNGGASGFWCVQGVPDKTTWEHHIAITGAGTAITITAQVLYHSGGGFYTDAGEIVVEPVASR